MDYRNSLKKLFKLQFNIKPLLGESSAYTRVSQYLVLPCTESTFFNYTMSVHHALWVQSEKGGLQIQAHSFHIENCN